MGKYFDVCINVGLIKSMLSIYYCNDFFVVDERYRMKRLCEANSPHLVKRVWFVHMSYANLHAVSGHDLIGKFTIF